MSLIETLSAFFGRRPHDSGGETPEGLCPNCWGREEYDGEIRRVLRDRQINVNNRQERYAFIQDFVVNHVDGIRLRNENQRDHCPTCKTYYG